MAASNPSCGRIGSTPARSDLRPRVPTSPHTGLICARPSCAACASFGRQPSRSPTPWIATPPGWDVLLPPSTTDRPPLDLPATLPPRDLARTAFALTGAEVATKARALDCYVTQPGDADAAGGVRAQHGALHGPDRRGADARRGDDRAGGATAATLICCMRLGARARGISPGPQARP